MSRKNKVKWLFLITAIVLVVFLAIELCVLRIADKEMSSMEVLTKVTRGIMEDMDAESESTGTERYSEVLGRELTADEEKRQRELEAQYKMLMYNNIGAAQDFLLPDETWFLDEDTMCFRLSLDKDGEKYFHFFALENEEIINRYRACWEDSFYSYDKNAKEMVERYRYYQLVFDSFYIDDMTVIPEQISIYKVESILPVGSDDAGSRITGFALVDTLKFEVQDTGELDYYELAGEIDQYNVTDLSYDYTCNGVEYSVNRDCTLNGKFYSVEERKALLEDCTSETYEFQDSDLVGFPKYHIGKDIYSCDLLGGDVTAVICDQNVLYNAYKYLWIYVIFVLLVDVAVAIGIAAIVTAIKERKKSH